MNNKRTSLAPFLKQNYKSISWAIIILIASLSHITPPDALKDRLIPHSDKIIHIGIYAIFSFLLLWDNKKSKGINLRLLLAFLYGVLMELLQYLLTDYRSMEFDDVVANLIGVLTGLFFYNKLKNKKILNL